MSIQSEQWVKNARKIFGFNVFMQLSPFLSLLFPTKSPTEATNFAVIDLCYSLDTLSLYTYSKKKRSQMNCVIHLIEEIIKCLP